MDPNNIDQVRRFNRLVTKRIGALEDSYLSRGRPLGEARVLFEIGLSGETGLQTLRQRLGLDSGYLSRLMRSLERQGAIELSRDGADARARLARLTLRASSVTVELEPAAGADARWCLGEYYAELARRFDAGFDPSAGNNFDPAETTPPKGWFLIARLDGEPVGCGALKRLDAATGEIKRVWTSPAVRGMGVASRIMDRLEEIAAEAGFARVCLDTNRALTEAHTLYRKRGYCEIAAYNDNPYADHWFGKAIC
jgi:DNA-binding MarR family transcriptional regulator